MARDADDLIDEIERSSAGAPAEAVLRTSERVLARVTDGIYRQPGSALRELVANAYDADASRVVIRTDRPRFRTISVEDDGSGMTVAVLARLLQNIGGSAKRQEVGAELGITSDGDRLLSPGGRRLIGRIGIGLFSVSQLCQAFTIITKVRGDDHRTIATVVLRTYGEQEESGGEDDRGYEAGRVRIWREPADDADTQGTTITLTHLRPQARATLQSEGAWARADPAQADGGPHQPPLFHIGRTTGPDEDTLGQAAHEQTTVPWDQRDDPLRAFQKLVDAVWGQVGARAGNPRLSELFDTYLEMVWQLALSVPLDYVAGHPFSEPFGDQAYTYALLGGPRARLEEVQLDVQQALGECCHLTDQLPPVGPPFQTLLDDLELRRPLRFTGLPTTSHVLTKPIIVAGRHREEFTGIVPELSGGPLSFEAYLMWNTKIAPTEHQGSLIRIHGASGTLFDPTFMRFQVAELTRRQQISCEIFISEGFESALNIDRESYNVAHPHAVVLTAWLHAALRKLINRQKALAAGLRATRREAGDAAAADALDAIAAEAWAAATGDEGRRPPAVQIGGAPADRGENQDLILLDGTSVRAAADVLRPALRRQLSTVASVLAAYGVAEALSDEDFDRLVGAIAQILSAQAAQ